MGIWKRFTDWWFEIPAAPVEQDEYGGTVIWPVGTPRHHKLWRSVRPAFTSASKLLIALLGFTIAGIIAWAIFVFMKDLTGLG
jgi:hypothetical protein